MVSNPTPHAYIGILYKIKKDTSVIDLIQFQAHVNITKA